MDSNIRKLIFQAIDQTISAEDFERLQDKIEQDEEVRSEYLRAVRLCESLGEIADNEDDIATMDPLQSSPNNSVWNFFSLSVLAIAATVLLIVGGAAFLIGRSQASNENQIATASPQQPSAEARDESETAIAGHATLRRVVDLQWAQGANHWRQGDVIPDGRLEFKQGLAEIDFFCGATLIIEGPATLDVESDWSVRVLEGRLRANVPPAARGFVVKAGESEIVDLGTEFALEVGDQTSQVEVIDGEIMLRGGRHDGDHLLTGDRKWLEGEGTSPAKLQRPSSQNELNRLHENAEANRFDRWKAYSQQLRDDDRLIAYYPIAELEKQRVVSNSANTGADKDGLIIGPVNRTSGRFGSSSAGLEFDRPGARVRTRIDGEFQSFTFACWVKIDSLENRYNALFMGDGYENGEPHWQIRDDGCLMFSVMVDDTHHIQHFNQYDQTIVTTAGLHRVYFSEPIWDISKSGQWFHIAAVYDPAGRRVTQYVNGVQVCQHKITDTYYTDKLHIGPAEIGNWGQPFRKTPWFAVRNLNGTIDELAIFNAVLSPEEIDSLYEKGKPLGY